MVIKMSFMDGHCLYTASCRTRVKRPLKMHIALLTINLLVYKQRTNWIPIDVQILKPGEARLQLYLVFITLKNYSSIKGFFNKNFERIGDKN